MNFPVRNTDLHFLKVYLITDRRLLKENFFLESVEEALAGGVKAIQLREKDLPLERLLPLAKEMLCLTQKYGARLFINSHAEMAEYIGADGVHLTESCPPVDEVKKKFPRLLTGVSTHSLESALKAETGGADFVTFSPIFDTFSKRAYGKPQGLKKLREVTGKIAIPVVALGGIKRKNVSFVMEGGAFGVALISGVWKSKNIKDTVHHLIQLTSGDLL